MTAVIVISTPVGNSGSMAAAFLPKPLRMVANGVMIFRFYDADEGSPDCEYRDLDGSLLIAYKNFASMADADAWIAAQVGKQP